MGIKYREDQFKSRKEYINIKNEIDKTIVIQKYGRRYIAQISTDILRCQPDHLFDNSFGKIRRELLKIDDKSFKP